MEFESKSHMAQEPVAISRRYRDGTVAAEFRNKELENGTKLYTHPQPKREPLSKDGMSSVLEEYYKTKGASFKTLIRLVEKAHGIGV